MKRIAILAALVCLIGCVAAAQELLYTQIDQETAKEMMARDDGHVVVDVRRLDEYDEGHIPGAILIPNESIGGSRPEALPDFDQIILVYCRSGNRSKQAAEKLAAMGYTNIYEFGGINTWTGEVVATEYTPTPAVLSFHSFDGGGHEYSVNIEDSFVISVTSRRDYGARDELDDGSPYQEIFTFTGLRPGQTTVSIYGRSPIVENDDYIYTALVDDTLNVTLESCRRLSTLFMYRIGEIRYDSYRVSHEPDGYHVSVNDETDQTIEAEVADALVLVIDEYDMAAWDGFDESNEFVLDGEGFWLEVKLTDGTSIVARGDNAFPDNYYPAMSSLQEILDDAALPQHQP